MFLPNILLITSYSIIDNIFSNHLSSEIISRNLSSTISDHLPQFLIFQHIFSDPLSHKFYVYKNDWSNFNQENFILDYFAIDGSNILKLSNKDTNQAFESFSKTTNALIEKHAPLEKSRSIKFKTKLSITLEIQKSISVKNCYFKKYINKKVPICKSQLHEKYKFYRNNNLPLLKRN